MNGILLGAIAMASFTAGVFFLRFWKSTGDRFFLFFAISFWMEAANRLILAFMHSGPEDTPVLYFLRFIAYTLILVAIADKNWPRKTNRV